MYDIMHLPQIIEIGKTGENQFRKIEIDMRPWLQVMPEGVASIVHIRPGETGDDAYVAATTMEDGILTWILSAGDIGEVEGYGQMEVWLEDLTGARGKSARCQTFVRSSLAPTSETPPEAQEAWLEQMTGLKTETVIAAQSAEDAKEAAESAQTAAEAARDAAQAAAGDFQGLSATASGLAAGTSPTVNVTHDEGGLFNLAFGIPKGDKGDQGDPPTDSQVQTAANNYLSQVITNPDSPPLDRALSSNAAAAPADMVGDLKSAINNSLDLTVGNSYTTSEGYISDIGAIVAPSSTSLEVYSSLIPVTYGQKLSIILAPCKGKQMWLAVAFYKSDETFISRRELIGNNTSTGSIIQSFEISNKNTAYIRVTWRTYGYASISLLDDYKNTISDIKESIEVVDEKIDTTKDEILETFGFEPLAPLILGSTQPYVSIVATASVQSLTLPADTLAIQKSGSIQIASSATTIEFDYTKIATSAIKIVYNKSNSSFTLKAYNVKLTNDELLIAVIRRSGVNTSVSIACAYEINGKLYGVDTSGSSTGNSGTQKDYNIKAINHRGYSTAPENTIPAYKESKLHGFYYVETDVSFTSDGVAVLLHDATINRTARNSDGSQISETINISDITYAQAMTYDFGIYKGSKYEGTKIPTFTEFIAFCRDAGLHPYIELKSNGSYTESQIRGLVDVVKNYGMKGKVTWISFSNTFLGYVKDYDDSARLGLVLDGIYQNYLNNALALKTANNEVFIDAYYTNTSESINLCIASGLPLEVWTVNTVDSIIGLNPYISGVTSDNLVAYKVLSESSME